MGVNLKGGIVELLRPQEASLGPAFRGDVIPHEVVAFPDIFQREVYIVGYTLTLHKRLREQEVRDGLFVVAISHQDCSDIIFGGVLPFWLVLIERECVREVGQCQGVMEIFRIDYPEVVEGASQKGGIVMQVSEFSCLLVVLESERGLVQAAGVVKPDH